MTTVEFVLSTFIKCSILRKMLDVLPQFKIRCVCSVTWNQRLVGFSSLHPSISVWCNADMVSGGEETPKITTIAINSIQRKLN